MARYDVSALLPVCLMVSTATFLTVALFFGGCTGSGVITDSSTATDSVTDSADTDTDTDTDTDVVLTCPDRPKCTEMFCDQVLIEAGEFTMGGDHPPHEGTTWPSGDERPPHLVYVDAFCIDTYEVTLERYENCVQAGACTPDGLQWDDTSAIDTVVNHYPRWCRQKPEECLDRAVNAKNQQQAVDVFWLLQQYVANSAQPID